MSTVFLITMGTATVTALIGAVAVWNAVRVNRAKHNTDHGGHAVGH